MDIKVNGRIVNISYAVDTMLIEESLVDLQKLIDQVLECSEECGPTLNVKKTVVLNKRNPTVWYRNCKSFIEELLGNLNISIDSRARFWVYFTLLSKSRKLKEQAIRMNVFERKKFPLETLR